MQVRVRALKKDRIAPDDDAFLIAFGAATCWERVGGGGDGK